MFPPSLILATRHHVGPRSSTCHAASSDRPPPYPRGSHPEFTTPRAPARITSRQLPSTLPPPRRGSAATVVSPDPKRTHPRARSISLSPSRTTILESPSGTSATSESMAVRLVRSKTRTREVETIYPRVESQPRDGDVLDAQGCSRLALSSEHSTGLDYITQSRSPSNWPVCSTSPTSLRRSPASASERRSPGATAAFSGRPVWTSRDPRQARTRMKG